MADFVRPRWGPWLARELERAKLRPDDLANALRNPDDPDNRDTAQRAAVRDWLTRKRIPSARVVFRVGQRLGNASASRTGIHGITALYAAGYSHEAMDCLVTLLDRVLLEYSAYAARAGHAHVLATRSAEILLEKCLRCAAALPVAHADLDGLHPSVVPEPILSSAREMVGAVPLEVCDQVWPPEKRGYGQWPYLYAWAKQQQVNPVIASALAWSAFVDSISLRMRGSDILKPHWNEKRKWFEGYRAAVFSDEPMLRIRNL